MHQNKWLMIKWQNTASVTTMPWNTSGGCSYHHQSSMNSKLPQGPFCEYIQKCYSTIRSNVHMTSVHFLYADIWLVLQIYFSVSHHQLILIPHIHTFVLWKDSVNSKWIPNTCSDVSFSGELCLAEQNISQLTRPGFTFVVYSNWLARERVSESKTPRGEIWLADSSQ